MKKYMKIYLKHFNRSPTDTLFCEMCGGVLVDVHHISPRGMGGNPSKDIIENLIGLCRKCHDLAEAGKISKEILLNNKK